jgi:hypothetical protein
VVRLTLLRGGRRRGRRLLLMLLLVSLEMLMLVMKRLCLWVVWLLCMLVLCACGAGVRTRLGRRSRHGGSAALQLGVWGGGRMRLWERERHAKTSRAGGWRLCDGGRWRCAAA